MDSGKHSFFLMSNEYSDLLEPLVNRCFVFNFNPYTEEDLGTIAKKYLSRKDVYLDYELLKVIVENSRLMPREIINSCKRLLVIFKKYGQPDTAEEMELALFN
jgi:DNA polymerase III delta prime subunit